MKFHLFLRRLVCLAGVLFLTLAAGRAAELSSAILFSCDSSGAYAGNQLWDTAPGTDFYKLWFVRGAPEAEQNSLIGNFLNGPDIANAPISIGLQPGANTFTIFAKVPDPFQNYGLTLFFDGAPTPTISAVAPRFDERQSSRSHFNSAPAIPNGTVSVATTASLSSGSVAIREFSVFHPAVYSADRVFHWGTTPDEAPDLVITFTVVYTPEPWPARLSWVNPSIQGSPLTSVVFGADRFVAAGAAGAIVVSTNGTSWTATSNGTSEEPLGLRFLNNRFFVWTAGGSILSSANGFDWDPGALPTTNTIRRVDYANGRYVAVGDHGVILTSTDGMNWSLQNSSTSANLSILDHAGDRFVAAGENGVLLTSADGGNWSAVVTGNNNVIRLAASGGGRLVMFYEKNGFISTTDGLHWNFGDSHARRLMNKLTYANGTFAAVGRFGQIATSRNGTNWIVGVVPTTNDLSGIAFGDGKWVVIGNRGSIFWSTNLVSWKSSNSRVALPLADVAFANHTFVTVAPFGIVLTAGRDLTWTSRSVGARPNLRSIARGNGRYVAVGENGAVLSSLTGLSWRLDYPTPSRLNKVIFTGRRFLAVGSDSTLLASSDGLTWNRLAIEPAPGNEFTGIAVGNGLFVIADGPASVSVHTSRDTVHWSGLPIGLPGNQGEGHSVMNVQFFGGAIHWVGDHQSWGTVTENSGPGVSTGESARVLMASAQGNGVFVAVGADTRTGEGLIITDSVPVPLPGTPALNDLIFVGGYFIAAGNQGTLLYSTDGKSWNVAPTHTKFDLLGVTSINGDLFVVGSGGTILKAHMPE
jgi:hypothetical protein